MSEESHNQLGRLEKVDLRDVWSHEAGDFTPWLAQPENITLLGDTIGLEVEEQEKSVGPFRADILCRDLTDGSWVLIENQLERTDHTHLGQLLTYAAGLEAVTIIWVAQRVTEEHRAALDWLNEKTPEDISFFGLEVELWRIAGSPVAPKFNIISKPNEWTQTMRRSNYADPERAALCFDYWSGVLEALAPSGILDPSAKPVRKQDIKYPVKWRDFWLKSYFSRAKGKLGVWVACRGARGLENFAKLEEEKDAIESAFGESLWWDEYERKNGGSIGISYENFDPDDREDWERQHQFLAEKLTELFRAVEPVVTELDGIEGEE